MARLTKLSRPIEGNMAIITGGASFMTGATLLVDGGLTIRNA